MHEHTYDIAQFIFELSEIPASDPLVHLVRDKRELVLFDALLPEKHTEPLDPLWNALLRMAGRHKRESDLQSLCGVYGQLAWDYKGKTVHSPLVLLPLSWKILKGKQALEWQYDPSAAFINPFVRHHLLRRFGYALPETEAASPEALLQEMQQLAAEQAWPVTIEALSGVGNFHHHRYQILRELELLQQAPDHSALVRTILGNESGNANRQLDLSPELLSPADADQLAVFAQLAQENTVIQGPPGTGKSQVLTNLIGKTLVRDGLTLVVSEKRVALEVLVKKLAACGLDGFTFTAHSQSQPKEFIRQLKAAWNALEQDIAPVPSSLLLSEQLKDALQLLMDRLNSPTLIGGVSFTAFRKLLTETTTAAAFQSDVPSVSQWLEWKPALTALERTLGSFAVLQAYKQALLSNVQLDQVLRKLEREVGFITATFPVSTFGDLEALNASVARCQLVLNESFRNYVDLHRKPRERKRFEKARLHFRDLAARLDALSAEKNNWKQPPSRSEAMSWLQQLTEKPSWFARRAFRKTLAAALNGTAVDPQTALTNWLQFLDLQDQLLDVRRQLAEWGIERPEVELESAAYIVRQLESEDPNELNRVAALSPQERQTILANGDRIHQLVQDLRRYLVVEATTVLEQLFAANEAVIEQVLAAVPVIRTLPEVVYRLIATGKPLPELQGIVLHSNWRLLEVQFPELARFDGPALEAKLTAILATEESEFGRFADEIRFLRKQRFDRYAQLLRTPAAQLKGDDKLLKARLKTGKALLVKEFGKSKQHQTIRELLSGDARLWIELLTPVWLSTPAQIGKTFPLEQDLFELVVFDEASQIPLPNALGALQRSKRAVVAGDEQQMAPSGYFSGSKVSVDLLHQASYYWKKVPLKHHYRSEHPALIAFSNRHFYHNELVAYPAAKASYPLFLHTVPNGVFDERINAEEAKAVAAFLETVSWKKSVGIVAFSEQQLDAIWQQCSPQVQERIAKGLEDNTVFFKALEQIQGDEADTVIIGMGYGKNAEGAFHLRFGPLNQTHGYKRLNVLLTRAKSELHFFTSVQAADFAVSSNESVNLLRLFLSRLEQGPDEASTVLPYGLPAEATNATTLAIPGAWEYIRSAQEFVTFHRVMTGRGWTLKY